VNFFFQDFLFSFENRMAGQPSLSHTEYDALKDFYDSTNGPSWRWANDSASIPWDFSHPESNPCFDKWQGLSCNCGVTNCVLTEMVLEHHNITHTIPDSIGSFPSLKVLDLRGNNITGSLTSSIGDLTNLISLDLSYNRLEGAIPGSIEGLSLLRILSLQVNFFQSIPETLYNIPSLRELDLSYNFMSGTISNNIVNLYNLLSINLNYNFFDSTIPSGMANLTQLTTIDFSYNPGIHGTFPSFLVQLKNLTNLFLNSMDLSGTLPENWNEVTNLRFFFLGFNSLYGTLPESMGNLTRLESFVFDNNLFSKSIPASFSRLHRMVSFYFEANSFTGELGPAMSTMYALTLTQGNVNFLHGNVTFFDHLNHTNVINYAYNSLSGPLPCNPKWQDFYLYQFDGQFFNEPMSACFSNFSKLHNFLVNNNFIIGSLPDPFLYGNDVLAYFVMQHNLLTGTIPSNLPNYRGLIQLIIEFNFLSGSLPENFGSLQRLVILTLNNNRFSGTLPGTFSNLQNIQEVFLQQNQFQGGLDNLFNSTCQLNMVNIDLSNNQLTGTIPSELYKSKSLESLTLSNNCLRGSISEEVCNIQSLVSLSLDGLSTSVNCQVYPFEGLSSIFTSFEAKHFLVGDIPFCLLELPAIELVHVSGNGLTGTIPSNLNITTSLNDISISHNLISGTIPINFQTKTNWYNFDFSYNKLSGTLSSDFSPINGTLSLDINRLSGSIPSSLLSMENITILNGNIFDCKVLNPENTLPINDSEYDNYSCGSDSVNFVLYSWIAASFVFSFLVIWGGRSIKRKLELSSLVNRLKEWRDEYHRCSPVSVSFSSSSLFFRAGGSNVTPLRNNADLSSTESAHSESNHFSSKPNIARLSVFFQEIRSLFLYLTAFAIVILLPVYSILKLFYSSYYYEYAWTISGMLLRGENAGLILFLLFTILLTALIIFMKRMVKRIHEIPLFNEVGSRSPSKRSSARKSMLGSRSTYMDYLVYLLIFLVNSAIMGVVDFSYIYIVVNYSSTVIALAVLGLAVFRIITNNLLLSRAIPYASQCVKTLRCFTCDKRETEDDSTSQNLSTFPESVPSDSSGHASFLVYSYSSRDISFLENIVLLNNIIIPILAVIFVLPDCFYYLLFEPPDVSSSYTYITCKEYFTTADSTHLCYVQSDTINYTPAFLYTYQCSSKIFINYVPVYVLMFIFIGIVIPFTKILMKTYLDKRIKSEIIDNSNEVKRSMCDNFDQWINTVLTSLVSETLKPVKPQPSKSQPLLFNKLRLTVQINSYLAIAITFGSLFPPLALIAGISVIMLITFEELSLGKLLYEARNAGYTWYEERIEKECAGIEESFTLTLWSTMIVSSCLFAYIIFDAVGDTEGWVNALPLTVLMVSVPILLYLGWKAYEMYWDWKLDREIEKEDSGKEDNTRVVENPSFRSPSQNLSFSNRNSELQMFSRDSSSNNKTNNSEAPRSTSSSSSPVNREKQEITFQQENPLKFTGKTNLKSQRKN
jgi:Leucine-rich repeat (LRR) protein